MKKIPKKYTFFLIPLFMGTFMGLMMSFIATAVNFSGPGFLFAWGKAFLFSWMIGLPIAFFAFPIAKKIVDNITE